MKKLAFALTGAVLAVSAANAQPVDDSAEAAGPEAAAPEAAAPEAAADAPVGPETPGDPADAAVPESPPADASLPPEPAPPADPLADAPTTAAAEVTDADIDSFAKATVKLREIQADTTIAADQKQSAMAAAVAETGLDAAKYNAIGQAAQADAELRAKVQTAMSRYAAPAPAEG